MITQLARQLRSALDGRSHDDQLIRKMGLQLTQLQTQLKKVSFLTKLFGHHRPSVKGVLGIIYCMNYDHLKPSNYFAPLKNYRNRRQT